MSVCVEEGRGGCERMFVCTKETLCSHVINNYIFYANTWKRYTTIVIEVFGTGYIHSTPL